MLLYNIVLGNHSVVPEKWSHIVDEHGNHFIANDSIRQRMRIDKGVDPELYPEVGELEPVWSSSNMQCYHMLPVRWVNNNKNMNPLLLMDKNADENNEQIVIYLTVASNYSILFFNTNHRILQTYHKNNVLQGCAIVLNEEERDTQKEFIKLTVYDNKKEQFSSISIKPSENDKRKILTERKAVSDKNSIKSMNDHMKKFKGRFMGFKIISKPKELLTSTYIVDKKFEEIIRKKTENISNITIYPVDAKRMKSDEEYISDLVPILKDDIDTNRIRSITLCGVNLSLNIIRDLKLLYVFNYDVKHDVLSCKKSN